VKLAKPQPTAYNNGSSSSSADQQVAVPGTAAQYNNMTAVHLQSSQPEYVAADDGGSRMLCRWQFDVSGYEPSNVKVNYMEHGT